MEAKSENKQSQAKRKRRARAVLIIWEEGSERKKKTSFTLKRNNKRKLCFGKSLRV